MEYQPEVGDYLVVVASDHFSSSIQNKDDVFNPKKYIVTFIGKVVDVNENYLYLVHFFYDEICSETHPGTEIHGIVRSAIQSIRPLVLVPQQVLNGYPAVGEQIKAIRSGKTRDGEHLTQGRNYIVYDNGDAFHGYYHIDSDEYGTYEGDRIVLTPSVLKKFFGIIYKEETK